MHLVMELSNENGPATDNKPFQVMKSPRETLDAIKDSESAS